MKVDFFQFMFVVQLPPISSTHDDSLASREIVHRAAVSTANSPRNAIVSSSTSGVSAGSRQPDELVILAMLTVEVYEFTRSIVFDDLWRLARRRDNDGLRDEICAMDVKVAKNNFRHNKDSTVQLK